MPAIPLVAIGTLDKDRRIRQALSKHFSTNVVEANTLPDMAACLLHHWIAVDIGEQTQTETLTVAGVCKNREAGLVERC